LARWANERLAPTRPVEPSERRGQTVVEALAEVDGAPRWLVSGTVGHVLVVVGAFVVVVVIVGGVLMARLLTTAAERADVWHRYGWPDAEGRSRRKHSEEAD
jgi:hypothetical protein